MPPADLSPFQIAMALLDNALANGATNPLETVETVLPSLGISLGSEEHFLLVYHNQNHLTQHGGHALPSPPEFGQRYSQWQSRAEKMALLKKSLVALRSVCGDMIQSTLESQGWKLIHSIKERERKRIVVASRGKTEPMQVVKAAIGMDCFESLKREFVLGRRLPRSRFVPTNSFGAQGEVTWFSMDFANSGTLELVRPNGAEPLSRDFLMEVWKWWGQAARSLATLHRLKLCHNDLKASNIFLHTTKAEKTRARLGDLQLVTHDGVPIRRKVDCWDHPSQSENCTAHRSDDIYRLAMTILWLLDPQVADGHYLENGRRLRLAGAQPEPFRNPLIACLRDRRSERFDNAMELRRLFAGAKF
jgi:serine/threonine protein kinase